GGTPRIFGDGGQTRDFVYVKDVVQANLLAMRTPEAVGGVFNIGTGRQTSLLELLAALQSIAGSRTAPEFAEARAGDIRDSVADISRARAGLGYESRHTLHEGLTALWKSLEKPDT
ncbi:MAG: NAD-dependent epimerase/dehydratase family protein, partial [Verrucomicrobia bacterium]|nr:NAD-dependent epimerase/dehydratase family protein [Verrucomicrobiota bacterium]